MDITRLVQIEAELKTLDDKDSSLEAFVRFAELKLLDIPGLWQAANPEERVRVRNLLFGDTLRVSPELQISNSGKPNLFSVLREMDYQPMGDGAP